VLGSSTVYATRQIIRLRLMPRMLLSPRSSSCRISRPPSRLTMATDNSMITSRGSHYLAVVRNTCELLHMTNSFLGWVRFGHE
jgi:hypothetical protein